MSAGDSKGLSWRGGPAHPSTARGDKDMQRWAAMGHARAGPGNNAALVGTYTPALTQPRCLLQTCSLKILRVLAR